MFNQRLCDSMFDSSCTITRPHVSWHRVAKMLLDVGFKTSGTSVISGTLSCSVCYSTPLFYQICIGVSSLEDFRWTISTFLSAWFHEIDQTIPTNDLHNLIPRIPRPRPAVPLYLFFCGHK